MAPAHGRVARPIDGSARLQSALVTVPRHAAALVAGLGPDVGTGCDCAFVVRVEAWADHDQAVAGDHIWLAGFDSTVTVVEADPPERLRASKVDEPCAGTDIVVTLADDTSATRIHVVQSRFGDWLPARYDMMSIGWRHIVADLQTYLTTTIDPRRHLRPWGDLGADTTVTDGAFASTTFGRVGSHIGWDLPKATSS